MLAAPEGPRITMTGFDSRFDELWAVAYRVAFGVLGDREEAADVAQETLIRLLARWSRYEQAAVGFTARVAGQRVVDVWRRRNRRPVPEVRPSPASPFKDRDELVTALRRLPERQRQDVILRYLGDLSERDTASAPRCSEGAVEEHASRGLASLRTVLNRESS